MNKGDRISHWVGYPKLKELGIYDLFERKQMIEDMDAELTGAQKNSNTDNLAVAEEEIFDEAITIEFKARNYMEIDL